MVYTNHGTPQCPQCVKEAQVAVRAPVFTRGLITNVVVASLVSRETVKRHRVDEIKSGSDTLAELQQMLNYHMSKLPTTPSTLNGDEIDELSSESSDEIVFKEDKIVPIVCLDSLKAKMGDNTNITIQVFETGNHQDTGIEFYKAVLL